MGKKTLDIVKKQLDITTADEKIAAGQLSDSEKMIAADMRRYLNDMQKQFEVVEELKKRDIKTTNNEEPITKQPVKESWFTKLINFFKNIKLYTII